MVSDCLPHLIDGSDELVERRSVNDGRDADRPVGSCGRRQEQRKRQTRDAQLVLLPVHGIGERPDQRELGGEPIGRADRIRGRPLERTVRRRCKRRQRHGRAVRRRAEPCRLRCSTPGCVLRLPMSFETWRRPLAPSRGTRYSAPRARRSGMSRRTGWRDPRATAAGGRHRRCCRNRRRRAARGRSSGGTGLPRSVRRSRHAAAQPARDAPTTSES